MVDSTVPWSGLKTTRENFSRESGQKEIMEALNKLFASEAFTICYLLEDAFTNVKCALRNFEVVFFFFGPAPAFSS